ncbi:MAG TPA: peptidyl-prolyl cis-trans isomerase [Thermoanaerobaculia bacterium]
MSPLNNGQRTADNGQRLHHFVLATLLLLALLACKKELNIPPDVIAQVGDRMITLAEYKRYLDRNAGTDLTQIAPEASSAILDQFLQEVLLSVVAGRRRIEVTAEEVAQAVRQEPGSTIAEERDQLAREKLIADVAARIPEPTEEQVRTYYREHIVEFRTGERIRARQILVREEALANQISKELSAGASFEALSEKHSLAPNAKSGGDIGFVGRGQLPKVFEDELFRLEPGSVSRVIRTDATFHVFRVDAFRPAGAIPYELAASAIRERVNSEALNRELDRVMASARQQIRTRIFTKRLPFGYSGSFPTSKDE